MFWVLLVVGCDDTLFSNGSGGNAAVTGHTYQDMKAIFANDCTVCHSGTDPLGDLDLEVDPWNAIVNVPSEGGGTLVVPGDHAASELWVRMSDGAGAGNVMPPSGKLDDATIQAVSDWIDAGAGCDCATCTPVDTAGDSGGGA